MRKLAVAMLIAAGLIAGLQVQSFASDWDKAGKVLAVFEGLRILTGGKADVIGTVTGINRPREQANGHDNGRGHAYGRKDDRPRYCLEERRPVKQCERVWVAHIVWKEKYVPEHSEYRPGYGTIWVGAHYETYQVEEGGHWETRYDCR